MAEKRRSGDRVLPSPFDRMSAHDREAWLACEALFDATLTEDMREANTGRTVTEWQDLTAEAQATLGGHLIQVLQACHSIALHPAARKEGNDG